MSSALWNYSHLVTTLVILVFLNGFIRSQDIGFPERGDEEANRKNAANRKPVYVPGRCTENELLYPGDQGDDWICDCSPGYLFHPDTNKCYSAYRQGPCPPGSFLILPKNKVIPECAPNPCKHDGSVLVRAECYVLGQPGPCHLPELSYVLGVDSYTLDLKCITQSVTLGSRFDDDANIATDSPNNVNLNEAPLCARGCRRYINGTCPIFGETVNRNRTTSKSQ